MSLLFGLILAAATLAASAAPEHQAPASKRNVQTAPEAFTSAVQVRSEDGALAGNIRIQVDKYTSDVDRTAMAEALKLGGYPAFVQALRKAPAVGFLEIGKQRFIIRWARQQTTEKGRTISVVTDGPAYFVGGGKVDAKPRAGFEVAVVQLTVDDFGLGTGTMAGAAKVKPDGQGGVVIEDYAVEPIKLTYVHREIA
jgi:hypothetical protein